MADQEKAKSGSGVGVGALAGGIAGAFIAGSVLAALAMMFLAKKKKKSHVSIRFLHLAPFSLLSSLYHFVPRF
jgi:hypothetical protein